MFIDKLTAGGIMRRLGAATLHAAASRAVDEPTFVKFHSAFLIMSGLVSKDPESRPLVISISRRH